MIIWMRRYPYSWKRTAKTIGAVAGVYYIGNRLYNWHFRFTNTFDGLAKIREKYECRNDLTEKFNPVMFNANMYPTPLLQVMPRNEDEFKSLLALCNSRGIAVAFWDKEQYVEGKVAKQVVQKPFIAVDFSKLNTVVGQTLLDSQRQKDNGGWYWCNDSTGAGAMQVNGFRDASR